MWRNTLTNCCTVHCILLLAGHFIPYTSTNRFTESCCIFPARRPPKKETKLQQRRHFKNVIFLNSNLSCRTFEMRCMLLTSLQPRCVHTFQTGSVAEHVYNTYKLMHTNQNVDFVKQKVNVDTTNTHSLNQCSVIFFKILFWLIDYQVNHKARTKVVSCKWATARPSSSTAGCSCCLLMLFFSSINTVFLICLQLVDLYLRVPQFTFFFFKFLAFAWAFWVLEVPLFGPKSSHDCAILTFRQHRKKSYVE